MVLGILFLVVYVYIALRAVYKFVTGEFSITDEEKQKMTREQYNDFINMKYDAACAGILAILFGGYQLVLIIQQISDLLFYSFLAFFSFLIVLILTWLVTRD